MLAAEGEAGGWCREGRAVHRCAAATRAGEHASGAAAVPKGCWRPPTALTLHGRIWRQDGGGAERRPGCLARRQPPPPPPLPQQLVQREPDGQDAVGACGGRRNKGRHARPVVGGQQQQAGPGGGRKQGLGVGSRVKHRGGVGAEEEDGEVCQAAGMRVAAQRAQRQPVQAQRRDAKCGGAGAQARQRVGGLGGQGRAADEGGQRSCRGGGGRRQDVEVPCARRNNCAALPCAHANKSINCQLQPHWRESTAGEKQSNACEPAAHLGRRRRPASARAPAGRRRLFCPSHSRTWPPGRSRRCPRRAGGAGRVSAAGRPPPSLRQLSAPPRRRGSPAPGGSCCPGRGRPIPPAGARRG